MAVGLISHLSKNEIAIMVARIRIMETKINKRREDYEKILATLMIEILFT